MQFNPGYFNSFELLSYKIRCEYPGCYIVIYRPPNPAIISWINEFPNLLSSVTVNLDKINLVGDFNLHIDDPSNCTVIEFLNIAKAFNLV